MREGRSTGPGSDVNVDLDLDADRDVLLWSTKVMWVQAGGRPRPMLLL